MFGAESVLSGSVGVRSFKVRVECACVKSFYCFRENGSEVDGSVVLWVAGGFLFVKWGKPVLFPGSRPLAVLEYGACKECEWKCECVCALLEDGCR